VLARTGDKQPGVEAEQQRLQRQRPRDQARGFEERRACCRAAALTGVHRRAEQAQDPHTSAGACGFKRQRASIGTPAARLTASCAPGSTTPCVFVPRFNCAQAGRRQSKQTLTVHRTRLACQARLSSSTCAVHIYPVQSVRCGCAVSREGDVVTEGIRGCPMPRRACRL